jgi:predicted small metal-binding protein
MSYCRANNTDSDVYVIKYNVYKVFGCLGCPSLGAFSCDTEEEMLQHLLEHRSAGHKVPERAINRLKREINSN